MGLGGGGPLWFLTVGGKSNHFEIKTPQHSVLLNNSRPSKETILPKPDRLEFYLSLTELGDAKYPPPTSSSFPVLPKWEKKAETHL